MNVSRRQFLQGMLAGAVVVAGELWVPGQKLISIPSGKVFIPGDTPIGAEILIDGPWHVGDTIVGASSGVRGVVTEVKGNVLSYSVIDRYGNRYLPGEELRLTG